MGDFQQSPLFGMHYKRGEFRKSRLWGCGCEGVSAYY